MPLTKKGKEIMKSMKEQYGKKKGKSIFYASKNKGTIKGVEKASLGIMIGKKAMEKSKEKTGTILPLGLSAFLESNRKKLKYARAEKGKMMSFKQFVKQMSGSQVSEKEVEKLKNDYIKKMSGSQVSEKEKQKLLRMAPGMKKGKMARVKEVKGALEKASKLHAAQAKTLGTVLKAAGGGLKEATKKLKAQGYKGGNMALKKIPEGPKGEGLKALKAKRPEVTREMGYAKKGKIMKAAMGKSVRGYGAARTSGSGLQDEQLIPGKSLDYYKDLM